MLSGPNWQQRMVGVLLDRNHGFIVLKLMLLSNSGHLGERNNLIFLIIIIFLLTLTFFLN